MGKLIKPYLFSAIVSYFIFCLFRETGVIGPPIAALLESEQLQNAFSPADLDTRTANNNNNNHQNSLGLYSRPTTYALRGSNEQQQHQQQSYPAFENAPKSSLYDFFPASSKTSVTPPEFGGSSSSNEFPNNDNNDHDTTGAVVAPTNNFLSGLTTSSSSTPLSAAGQHATTFQDAVPQPFYSASSFSQSNPAVPAMESQNAGAVDQAPLHQDAPLARFSTSSHVFQSTEAPQLLPSPIEQKSSEGFTTALLKQDSEETMLENDSDATTPELPKDTPEVVPPAEPQEATTAPVAALPIETPQLATTATTDASLPQITPFPLEQPESTTTTVSLSTGSSSTAEGNPPEPSTTAAAVTPTASLSSSSKADASRPTMHTFFEYIPSHVRGTQMTDEADHLLLREWISSWEAAGWNTKILSLTDAKRHADYDMYAAQLQMVPLMGEDGLGNNVVYNQLCFLRWLAMAAVGGGYMSDYDVFPLRRVPSNLVDPHGNFTVHAVVKGSHTAGIPCLMSGSASEWSRMARAIVQSGLDVARNNSAITMWSDMMALIDMRKQQQYHVQDTVVEGQDVLVSPPLSNQNYCAITRGKMAIHFSHQALRQGHLLPGETIQHRAQIARRFFMESLQHQQKCSSTAADGAGVAAAGVVAPIK